MKTLRKILILVVVATTFQAKAQDPQFSQFYSLPLYLSPSLAGASDQSRLIINYRNQWASLPKAFTTYAFSFDHYMFNYKSGIGIQVLRDQEGGVFNTTSAGLAYSYVVDVNHELKIRPGLSASYFFRNIDYSQIEFADQISRESSTSIELLDNELIQHYDFAVSMLAYTSKYWFGATADHLLSLNKNFSTDPTYPALKLAVYGGTRFELFKRVRSQVDKAFTVSFFYKNQAGFQQLDLGTNYEREPFRIGLWFRGVPLFNGTADMNAVVLLAGITYRDFLINYSYDISTSRLLASTGGAHEISVAYRFNSEWGGQKRKMRAVPCPEF